MCTNAATTSARRRPRQSSVTKLTTLASLLMLALLQIACQPMAVQAKHVHHRVHHDDTQNAGIAAGRYGRSSSSSCDGFFDKLNVTIASVDDNAAGKNCLTDCFLSQDIPCHRSCCELFQYEFKLQRLVTLRTLFVVRQRIITQSGMLLSLTGLIERLVRLGDRRACANVNSQRSVASCDEHRRSQAIRECGGGTEKISSQANSVTTRWYAHF